MLAQWLIQFDTIYLTRNDLAGGERYLVNIEGIEELMSDYTETEFSDFKANLISQVTQVDKKSKRLVFNFAGLKFAKHKELVDLRNSQKASGNPVNLILTHPYNSGYNFDLQVNLRSVKSNGMSIETWRNVTVEVTTFEET